MLRVLNTMRGARLLSPDLLGTLRLGRTFPTSRRTPLPRTWVHKGKRKGRGVVAPTLVTLSYAFLAVKFVAALSGGLPAVYAE